MDSGASTSGRSTNLVLLFTGGVLVGSAVAAGAVYAYLQYLPGPDVDARRPRRRVKTGVGCVPAPWRHLLGAERGSTAALVAQAGTGHAWAQVSIAPTQLLRVCAANRGDKLGTCSWCS